jgi:hypothetical protein
VRDEDGQPPHLLGHRRQFLHLAAGAAALPAMSRIARALDYPTRPVRIIAATAPGGLPDILARLIGPWLSGRLGQQFVAGRQAERSELNRAFCSSLSEL